MAQQRAGRTVKISISLDKDDVAVLKRYARASHGGNLSAAFSEAARILRKREAGNRLIEMLGGRSLTPEIAAKIEAEQRGELPPERVKRPVRKRAP